ncbi:MAG: DUF4249 domain-containing protein [Muribaculaceae bacterium]|nr:DUF4249 domain-containing protein [Muribaculaceae bacterium]
MISNISDGDSIKVSLTHTWRWSDKSESISMNAPWGSDGKLESDLLVEDALVKLYVNDEYKETLKLGKGMSGIGMNKYINGGVYYPVDDYPWATTGYVYYIADYIPQCGDKIRLEAESEEYGSAWAEVTVPQTVEIDSVDYTVSNFDDRNTALSEFYLFNMNLSVWFSDPGNETNYYMFETSSPGYFKGVDAEGLEYEESVNFRDVTDDPLFTEHVSAIDHVLAETSGYSLFSDRQISGKSYPLHVRLEGVSYQLDNRSAIPDAENSYIKFILYSISPSYYRHVISVWAANDGIVGALGDVGLAEPVFAASNVSTGAGVVSASAKYEYKLYMRPLIESIQKESQQ